MNERTVIQSIAQPHVVSLAPSANVYKAANVMTDASCSSVLVIDAKGSLLGILTEHDLMTRVLAKGQDPQHTRLVDVMTPKPYSVPPDTKVTDALVMMMDRGFRHLPIVDAHETILGVFSMRDAQPLEVNNAMGLSEFGDQLNDALA